MSEPQHEAIHTPGVLWFEGESPIMLAAIRKAQQHFSAFETVLNTQSSNAVRIDDAAVKVFFPSISDPRSGEHMWVNDVSICGDTITGVLQNDATNIPGLVAGRVVQFHRDRISDWFYVINGIAEGGFTIKIMLKEMTPEQFRLYCGDPPTCYFANWYAAQQESSNE
jgi:uncharacterized protein YegJ (DUF2314 family)